MRDPFDRGSKWLIDHYGLSLLRLGRVEGVRSWRALQAEVTHPKQLPDGLLEAYLEDRTEPDLFLIEVSTYPDPRVYEQLARHVALVWLDRRVLPEVITLVLHSRGDIHIGGGKELHSRLGLTSLQIGWRVVEMWKEPAEKLLAANDVGLIPWVPLSEFAGPPEVLLKECRARIDAQAPAEVHGNLLAITQVMTQLRYNDPTLLDLFGGKQAMIESPLIQELLAETKRKDILRFLSARFRPVPNDIASALQQIRDEAKLDELIDLAGKCANLEEFRSRLGLGLGKTGMIESPLIQELLAEAGAETKRKDISEFLSARFPLVPNDSASALQKVQDVGKLDQLVRLAGRCANLEESRTQLGLG